MLTKMAEQPNLIKEPETGAEKKSFLQKLMTKKAKLKLPDLPQQTADVKQPEPQPVQEQQKQEVQAEQSSDQGLSFEIDLTQKFIVFPDIKDKMKVDIRYPLIAPYAYAHLFWDNKRNELVYSVEEPELNEKEKELFKIIVDGLEEMVSVPVSKSQNPKAMIAYLEKNVQSLLAELAIPVSKQSYLKIMYYVYRNFIGLNEIEPLLRDYYIEDIECNGVNYPIYVVHRKFENIRTDIVFNNVELLGDFVEKLAQKAGRYVSYANPLLDGALPDGSRVNATYTKDITTRGPTFTIRKFTKEPWTAIHLIDFGTASPEIFAYLWMAIQHKFNIMIIGETASGKTTFLNTIVHFIPPEARICSIEDTRELNLAHDNWLPSVSRSGFGMPSIAGGEKYGEVSLFDLLKETFRQNPDYVIVGEARGQEASVLFQGMASGHPSFSTFHAGSVETFVRRLETPPISLSPSLVEVLDIVCICSHVKTREQNIRRLKAVEEIDKIDTDWSKSIINHRFKWQPAQDSFASSKKSLIFERICEKTGITMQKLQAEYERRTKLLAAMQKKKVFNFKDVAKVFNDYYNDQEKVLKYFGVN
jgi:flagellar protein FlaI